MGVFGCGQMLMKMDKKLIGTLAIFLVLALCIPNASAQVKSVKLGLPSNTEPFYTDFANNVNFDWQGGLSGGFNLSWSDGFIYLQPKFKHVNGNEYSPAEVKALIPAVNFQMFKWNQGKNWKYAINMSGIPVAQQDKFSRLIFELTDSSGVTPQDYRKVGNNIIIKDKYAFNFFDLFQSFTVEFINKSRVEFGDIQANIVDGVLWIDPYVQPYPYTDGYLERRVTGVFDVFLTESTMRVGTNIGAGDADYVYRAYMKYNTTVIDSWDDIINATFNYRISAEACSGGDSDFLLQSISDYNDLGESDWDIIHNNISVIYYAPENGTGWYVANVTGWINKGAITAFRVQGTYEDYAGSDCHIQINSNESAYEPYIEIYYSEGIPPEVTVSLHDYYAIDSNGSRIDDFDTFNLQEIEQVVLNYTIWHNTTLGNWYFNFTADGEGACALGNQQSDVCYSYDNATYKWIQFINGTVTPTFDGQNFASGDGIVPTVVTVGNTTYLTLVIDEHYNPNVMKHYNAEYDLFDVKWQDGADQRIYGDHMIGIELPEIMLPANADQFKADFRVNYTGNPTGYLNLYGCNESYSSGNPSLVDSCSLASQLHASDLQDDGTKFRHIGTGDVLDAIGAIKYAVIASVDVNATDYFVLKTYKATAPAYTTKWYYSINAGTSWSNLGDGYESELNVNWFFDGADPTSFRFLLFANSTDGDTGYAEGNITWNITPTHNYMPLVNLVLPTNGDTIQVPYTFRFSLIDPNADTLNGTLQLYSSNGTFIENLVSGLTTLDEYYYWSDTIQSDDYIISLLVCELGTPELYCVTDNHTVTISKVLTNATLSSIDLYYSPYAEVGVQETIYAIIKVGGVNYADAYVEIAIDGATAVLSWDSDIEAYLVYWIPSVNGVYPFNVSAEANNTLNATGEVTVATPFNITVRLWNEINMTPDASYVNNFAWIYLTRDLNPSLRRLFGRDRFACPPQGDDECYWHGKYVNGSATVTLWEEGNYSMYIIGNNIEWRQSFPAGGIIDCDFCAPAIIQSRFRLNLGNYYLDEAEEFDLLYSRAELYVFGAIFGVFASWLAPVIFALIGLAFFIVLLITTHSLKSALAGLVLLPTIIFIILTMVLW